MAILAAINSKISLEKILKIAKKIKPVNGRLEKIGRLNNNGIVILDYAHTPDALETCLKNIMEQFKLRKINLVFGCGGDRDRPKRKIMGRIANRYCNKIYLTDDNPRNEHPKKINSILGEDGLNISGGQRQRLGIARALYQDPEILVFDEATSSLDIKNEKLVMQTINSYKGSKTMIIISHKIENLSFCDQIIKL